MTSKQQFARWKFWVVVAITIAIIAAAALVLPGLSALQTATTTPSTQGGYLTAPVTHGSLDLETTGTGTLVARSSVDLGFSVSGTLNGLEVKPGDTVKAGQVLATLKEIALLKQAVENKKLALKIAQDNLDTISAQGAQILAAAQGTLARAESAYADAQANTHQKGDPRCPYTDTKDYWWDYFMTTLQIRSVQGYLEKDLPQRERNYILDDLDELQQQRDRAYVNFHYCEGFTEIEILQSNANLQLSKANLDTAKQTYQSLQAHTGVDPTSLEMAQMEVTNAELQLLKSQVELDGATIIAPLDSTVITVNAVNGDAVGTDILVTLADITHPLMEAKVDETDLLNFAVGCLASVSFDAVPDRVFLGTIVEVYPTVSISNNVSALQGIVELDNTRMTLSQPLPLNLSGTVEITCQISEDALLVPVDALHEETGSSSFVYVINVSGQLEKRTVLTGNRNTLYVEILEGLIEGEQIITSNIN
jgi:HlyD family secretion protein